SLPPAANTQEEEVTFQDGAVTLVGTLILPETAAPHPAVVFVHGAPPNERGPYHDFAKYVFARYGVAALIYDKRGYGQSSGQAAEATLDDLAGDVVADVRYLQR